MYGSIVARLEITRECYRVTLGQSVPAIVKCLWGRPEFVPSDYAIGPQYDFERYMESDWTDPGNWLLTAIAAIVSSCVGYGVVLVWISRQRRLSAATLIHTHRATANEAWSFAMATVIHSLRIPGTLAGIALGAFAAEVGESTSAIYVYIQNARFERFGTVPNSPHALFGLLAKADAAVLLLGTASLVSVPLVIVARRNFKNSEFARARWCPRCGYPRPQTSASLQPPVHVCTECGHEGNAPPKDSTLPRRLTHAAWMLLLVSVAAFFLVPRFFSFE